MMMKRRSGKLAIVWRALKRSALFLCVCISLCVGVFCLHSPEKLSDIPLPALFSGFSRPLLVSAVVGFCLFCFVWNLIREKRAVLFRSWVSPDKDLTIRIRRGDIFTKGLFRLKRKDGTILLGIDDRMGFGDYSPTQTTLLNQLRGRFYRRDPRRESDWLPEFFKQKRKEYCEGGRTAPIGTFFPMNVPVKSGKKGQKFLVAVMSHTSDNDHSPCTTLADLKATYIALFSTENLRCVNDTLYCPLLGGESRKNGTVSAEELLLLAAKSYLTCAQSNRDNGIDQKIKTLVFVIPPKTFAQMDVVGLYSKLDVIASLNALEQKSRSTVSVQSEHTASPEAETEEYQILQPQPTSENLSSPNTGIPVGVA